MSLTSTGPVGHEGTHFNLPQQRRIVDRLKCRVLKRQTKGKEYCNAPALFEAYEYSSVPHEKEAGQRGSAIDAKVKVSPVLRTQQQRAEASNHHMIQARVSLSLWMTTFGERRSKYCKRLKVEKV